MDDDRARNRFLIINVARLSGVAMVILGMLVTQRVVAWPIEAGYALIVLGLVEAFVVPQLLARRWRSPPE